MICTGVGLIGSAEDLIKLVLNLFEDTYGYQQIIKVNWHFQVNENDKEVVMMIENYMLQQINILLQHLLKKKVLQHSK
jgi:hypothetical protein